MEKCNVSENEGAHKNTLRLKVGDCVDIRAKSMNY